MSTPIDDGGPAFPTPDIYHPDGQVEYGAVGMTLRDYFAGQALAGILANPQSGSSLEDELVGRDLANHVSEASYAYADAMIRERK